MAEFIKGRVTDEVLGSRKWKGLFPSNKEALVYQENLAYEMTDGQLTFTDLLEQGVRYGISLRQTSLQISINRNLLVGICRASGINISRTEAMRAAIKRKWQDPDYREGAERVRANLIERWQDEEYRKKQTQVIKAMLSKRWQDPAFKEKMSALRGALNKKRWQDPDFRARNAAATKAKWQDQSFRERNIASIRKLWQDLGFRARIAEANRAELARRWQDPEYRRRQAERGRAILRGLWQDSQFREMMIAVSKVKWDDPDFRQKNREALNRARLTAEKQGRYYLPTIQGERRDIGYAKSAWEANVKRVLLFVGREVLTNEALKLSNGTQFEIDFVTTKADGGFKLYEIMAHPLENPEGWDKLNLAQIEYPEFNITPITRRMYHRIARRFQARIDADPNFCGWEREGDNLRDNPQKYAPSG